MKQKIVYALRENFNWTVIRNDDTISVVVCVFLCAVKRTDARGDAFSSGMDFTTPVNRQTSRTNGILLHARHRVWELRNLICVTLFPLHHYTQNRVLLVLLQKRKIMFLCLCNLAEMIEVWKVTSLSIWDLN